MSLTVESLTTIGEFYAIRHEYEAVYGLDPARTVFVSWPWLCAYFRASTKPWQLLVARDGKQAVGFCLLVHAGLRIGPLHVYRELALGAYPTGDYSSLLIAARESDVLGAFARWLLATPWDVLRFENVHDARVMTLAELLATETDLERRPRNTCRYVPLPASWDAYAARHRSGENSTKYVVRRRNAWRDARFEESDAATIDRDIEVLLRMHHARWNSNLDKARRTYGRLFKEAHKTGCCRVGVLRGSDDRPLAAQAAFVDPQRERWGVYMLAYDPQSSQRSPGIGMLAIGLERAIGQGFAEYDFMRGDEPYKAQFGAEVRLLDNVILRRRGAYARLAERLWSSAVRWRPAVRRRILSLLGR